MKQIFFIMAIAVFFFVGGNAHADERAVPNMIAYQSSLYDDGGNPIADGQANVVFRITDVNGQILYEEHQTLDVVRGQVSALIGNGLTRNGAPTGGISPSMFDPVGTRYLEVQAGDLPPMPAMEIASVPYSNYAGVALSVAEGSIESPAIADGGIAYDDLSAELVTRLSNEITGGRGADQILYREDLDNLYRAPTAAAAIGIRPGLVYSGANDLQGAIQDIDRAVKRRDEKIETETRTREEANTVLQINIDSEANTRITADATLQTNITNEVNARSAADSTLQTNINNEASARAGADSTLQTNITNEINARSAADSTLQTIINNEASARSTADSALESAKVSKSGDTMTGNLAMSEGTTVDGKDISAEIDSINSRLGLVVDEVAELNTWGTVQVTGTGELVVHGHNISVSNAGITTYEISFSSALASEYYAVLMTPAFSRGGLAGVEWSISPKTATGFTVSFSPGCGSFDFFVVGP